MMDQGVAAPPAEAHNLQDLPLALFIDDLDEYNQFRNYVSSMPGRMSPPRQQISHDLYHSQIPITSSYRDHTPYTNLSTSPEKIYTTLQSRTDFSISSLAAPPSERSCHSLPPNRNTSSVGPPPNEKMYHTMSNQSNNYNNSSTVPDERSYHSLMSKNNNCNNSSPMLNDQSMYHHMYNNRPANCNSPGDNMATAATMDQRSYHAMTNQRPYNSSSPMSTSDERTYHSLNSRPPSTHMQQGGTNNATSVIMSAHNSPVPPGAPPPAMPNGPCGMGGMTPRDNGHMDGHMDRHMEANPDWQMGGHQVNDVNHVTSTHQNYMDRGAVNANYNNTTNNHRHSQQNEVPYDNGNYNHNRYEHGEESQAINMSKGSTKEAPKFVANNTNIKSERLEHVSSSSVPHHGYTPQGPEPRKEKKSSSYQLNNPRLKKVDVQFFKCSLCSYRTKLKKSYEKHVEWHKKCKHKCETCNASFSNDKLLRDHKYQHLRKEQPKFSDSFSDFIKKSTEKDKVETTNVATTSYKKTKPPMNPRKTKSASLSLKAEDVKFVKNKDLPKEGKKALNKRSTEVYNMIGMLLKEQTSPLNLSQQRAKSSLDKRLQGISSSLQKTQGVKQVTKQPVDAFAAAKQSVDAYQAAKQSVDTYAVAKQSVDAYAAAKQSVDTYAVAKQSVDAYTAAKQSVDTYAVAKQPVDAYSVAKQSVDAYTVAKQSVDAHVISDVKPEIKTELIPNVKMVAKQPMSSASCSSSSVSSSNIISSSIPSSITNSGFSTSLTNNGIASSFSNSALSNSGCLPSSLMSSGFPSSLVSSGLPTSFTSSGLQSPLASSGLMNSVVPTSLTNSLLAPSLMNSAVPNSFANQLSGMSAQLTSSSFQNSLMNSTIQNSFMNNEAVPSSLNNLYKFRNFNQAPQSQNPQSRKRDYFNIQQFF